jgi:MFS family permease
MADVVFAVNINNDNETKMKDKNDDIEDNNKADDGDDEDETPIKGAGDNSNNNNNNSNNNFNMYTIFVCIVACSGALLFGLDVGITGGVMAQSGFLLKFFPSIYEDSQNHSSGNNAYCTFDSQLLAFFTSSFFLAGMVSSIIASKVTATKGRKFSMMVGALLYLLGSLMNALAINTYMLIIGRLFLGFGCGFVNQSVPMFLAEIPPVNIRGALQVLFQASIAIGILIAGTYSNVTLVMYIHAYIIPFTNLTL